MDSPVIEGRSLNLRVANRSIYAVGTFAGRSIHARGRLCAFPPWGVRDIGG